MSTCLDGSRGTGKRGEEGKERKGDTGRECLNDLYLTTVSDQIFFLCLTSVLVSNELVVRLGAWLTAGSS